MKTRCSNQKSQALTLIEVLVVIGILVLFFGLMDFGPSPNAKEIARRVACVSNLKQVNMAYLVWAGNHHDNFPMQLSVTNGGTMELMDTANAWKTVQVISNELSSPRLVICPSDSMHRTWATNFGNDLKNKISYFIGIDATETNPNALVAGDGNLLLNNSIASHGLINASSNDLLVWDASRHYSTTKQSWSTKPKTGFGNIGLADGSVLSLKNSDLTNQLRLTGLATNRLAIP